MFISEEERPIYEPRVYGVIARVKLQVLVDEVIDECEQEQGATVNAEFKADLRETAATMQCIAVHTWALNGVACPVGTARRTRGKAANPYSDVLLGDSEDPAVVQRRLQAAIGVLFDDRLCETLGIPTADEVIENEDLIREGVVNVVEGEPA